MNGLSYNQKQVITAGTLILYRLLDAHSPTYHENYPIIKPILFSATTMVSIPGLSGVSIDMGICMGAWLRLRACVHAISQCSQSAARVRVIFQ